MKAPSAPPNNPLLAPEYPPPPYDNIVASAPPATPAPLTPKKRKIFLNLVEARKAAFVLSCAGIAFSFILFFIIFFEAIAFIFVCALSAYAFYNKSAFLYIPHICFLVLNNILFLLLSILGVVSIFAPEIASSYIPYLPDILKEWYRYFAFFVALFFISITVFTFWVTEIYYKAYKCTRAMAKHQQVIASLA